MAKKYYEAIMAGKKTIEDVPARWRDEVERMLSQSRES